MRKFFLFLTLIIGVKNAKAQTECPILPHPVTFISSSSGVEFLSFDASEKLKIDTANLSTALFEQFQFLLKFHHNLSAEPISDNSSIEFKRLKNVIEDSYTIQIDKKITISYSSDRSCYYAFQSLMQLIERMEIYFNVQKCFVSDYPKFQWRGLHLDVARHFFNVEEVKRYIDLMAIYKFNTFHWHLTDDQGWRIEIKKFPKLTEIGAWRDSTVENHYTTTPRTYKKEKYGGFYTQEEIQEVVKYAADRFITIVPEIEMPGHARAALAAYPEYSCTGIQHGVEGLWGVFDDIFCSKEASILFLQSILEEIIPLFPGEYFHIGGDEAPKTRWKTCDKCQKVMKENKLKDEHELQSYFVQRMDKFLSSKGKKLIGWDEILEGGLSPNAAVMSWRGFEGGIEAANQNHFVVMSPGSHCYFDHYQSRGKEPLAIGGFTSLEKVYSFNPIPEKLKPEKTGYILGAQANLWTEYIPTFSQLEYMTFPRAIALSQVLWNDKKPDFSIFRKTLIHSHLPILSRLEVNYSHSFMVPTKKLKRSKNGVSLSFDFSDPEESIIFSRTNNTDKTPIFIGEEDEFEIKRTVTNRTDTFNLFSFCCGEKLIIHNSPALGLPIKLITQPNSHYNNGTITLVDGIRGTLPWKGNEWVGFDTSTIIIELDLLKKQKMKGLEISLLKDEGSWIHLPYKIEITNEKGKTFSTKTISDELAKKSFKDELVFIPITKKSKTLKITIHAKTQIEQGFAGAGNQPWTFIDEIRIVK